VGEGLRVPRGLLSPNLNPGPSPSPNLPWARASASRAVCSQRASSTRLSEAPLELATYRLRSRWPKVCIQRYRKCSRPSSDCSGLAYAPPRRRPMRWILP